MIGNRVLADAPKAPDETRVGIRVQTGGKDHLIANVVESVDGVGILLGEHAFGTVVRGNIMRNNEVGLHADATSREALITGNSFEDNRTQARDEGTDNRWDDGVNGNYWSDLQILDSDGDGIHDQPREIPPRGLDRYPLAEAPQ